MCCLLHRWSRPFFLVCLLLNVLAFILVFASQSPLLASDQLTLQLQFAAASSLFLILFGGPRALLALLVAALRTTHSHSSGSPVVHLDALLLITRLVR